MVLLNYLIRKGHKLEYIFSLSPAEKILILGSILADMEREVLN